MSDAGGVLLVIFQHAWTTLAALTIIVAMLGGLAQVMKLAGGQMIGSSMWVGEAIAGIVGVVIIALVGFLAIPAIVRSVTSNNAVLGCGPIAEIGQFSALLIGGIGSSADVEIGFYRCRQRIDRRERRRFDCADRNRRGHFWNVVDHRCGSCRCGIFRRLLGRRHIIIEKENVWEYFKPYMTT